MKKQQIPLSYLQLICQSHTYLKNNITLFLGVEKMDKDK